MSLKLLRVFAFSGEITCVFVICDFERVKLILKSRYIKKKK